MGETCLPEELRTLSDPGAVKLGTLIEHGDWVRYWTEQV